MTKTTPLKKLRQQNAFVQPFVKWAGGKRQLLPAIRALVPHKVKCYYEPFLGGGAVLFGLTPLKAVVNDVNAELINCYLTVRDHPEELLEHVQTHQNTSEYFYQLREQDRDPKFGYLTAIERASRLLYLNKTCFNGLFRVNSQGQFNVPFGDYKNPLFADPAVIRAVSQYLKQSDIQFRSEDFARVVEGAAKGDFVYLDPPYDPVSDTASFTGYNLNGFDREEQRRLKATCDGLTQRGVRVLLSNSSTAFIEELYSTGGYTLNLVEARRNINSNSSGRGKVGEFLIVNYEQTES
jgi:DNA adenine methylase